MSLAEIEYTVVLGGVKNPLDMMKEFHEYRELSDIIGIRRESFQNKNSIHQIMSTRYPKCHPLVSSGSVAY